MTEAARATSGFAPRVKAYIAAIAAAGVFMAAVLALNTPAHATNVHPAFLAIGLALVFLACVGLHARAFTLPWRGERISVSPDEAVLLVAFVYLPSPAAALVALLGAVGAHFVNRKPLVKAVFTCSVYALSVGAAVAVHTGVRMLGFGAFEAAALVPVVVSGVSHVLVAVLLTLLAGERLRAMWKPELFSSITISAVAGLTLGFLALALLTFHPAAGLLILPVGHAFYKAMAAEYRHQNELAVRRALSRASERIVGEPSEDAIADAVFAACREVASMHAVEITLRRPGAPERRWDAEVHAPERRAHVRVTAPLHSKDGAPLGEFAIRVPANGGAQRAEDEELAKHIAGYLSIAFGTSGALSSLARTEQRLRSVFNAARDAILVLGDAGRVVYCNAHAQKLFDVYPEAGDNPRLMDLLDEDSAKRFALWLEIPHDGTEVLEVETRAGEHDRRILELSVSSIALDDPETGTLVVGRDITERRKLEDEAEAQREVLVRNDRLAGLGILVAGVAHEVNNPLAFLGANIELAVDDVTQAEADLRAAGLPSADTLSETRQALSDALDGVQRLSRIAGALQIVARKQDAPAPTHVDASGVVQSVWDLVKASVPSNVAFLVDVPEAPASVRADPSELHQVVLNLTKNALDAVGDADGTVTVACKTRKDVIEIRVTDDGPGIPPEARAQVFTPFYTTKTDGTGLGLAITHRIVTDYGGQIRVESRPGEGATFIVTLPRAEADAE